MESIDGSVPDLAGKRLSPFSPCPFGVVDMVHELLCITEDDVVVDVGSGAGRVLIEI